MDIKINILIEISFLNLIKYLFIFQFIFNLIINSVEL